ncbi:hypothetical protein MNBD_DELTA01-1512 [hydrothermal vent metagenome]|uniref:Uncharacterized protein n=1 Tax=hydrothermal vent metagenome TaxID=652676 RepID=A0A3B0R2A6_9ZZZZ
MAGRLFEMQIESLEVTKRGTFTGKEDIHTLGVTLVYPRAGVKAISTIKALKADKPIPDNFPSLSYHERVLFKENILGECQLTVEVVAVNKPTTGEKFFTDFIRTVFSAALTTTIAPGISNVILANVTENIGGSIFENIEAKESVQKLGTAYISINTEDEPLQENGTLVGKLIVPEDIKIPKPSVFDPVSGFVEYGNMVLLKKDVEIGKVVISYREIKEQVSVPV